MPDSARKNGFPGCTPLSPLWHLLKNNVCLHSPVKPQPLLEPLALNLRPAILNPSPVHIRTFPVLIRHRGLSLLWFRRQGSGVWVQRFICHEMAKPQFIIIRLAVKVIGLPQQVLGILYANIDDLLNWFQSEFLHTYFNIANKYRSVW